MGSTGFSDGRGCSNRWLKKWFLSALWLRRTMQGKVLNWRGIVVDSAIGGRAEKMVPVSHFGPVDSRDCMGGDDSLG